MTLRIAVASGKGGTGKTTVSANLAVTAAAAGRRVRLCDCDVEEPNAHLLLEPTLGTAEAVRLPVPVVDQDACRHCGRCADICEFHAIACMPERTVVFEDLCHACGGCWLVCPEQAIGQGEREIGVVEEGLADAVAFAHGRLRIGEIQVPPLIEAVKAKWSDEALTVLDAPPGATCPVVATLKDCDLVVLVTEPTPFGLHDLQVAVELVREMGLPCGVVVNREGQGDDRVQRWCRDEGIPLLPGVPFSREAAEAGSRGELLVEAVPAMKTVFEDLLEAVLALARKGEA